MKPIKKTDVLYYVVITVVLLLAAFFTIFDVSKVSGESMNPTLENGDVLFVQKKLVGEVKRGDIISVNVVIQGEVHRFAKRVLAIGGDTIEYQNDEIFVNGELLVEDYILEKEENPQQGILVLEENEYFVVGDNRNASFDSRIMGAVHADDVNGIVRFK